MIRSKLPNIGVSIFSEMSDMANEFSAVNLSQGFPDFEISEKLISLSHKYMSEGNNQYAPMPGVLKLRQKISQKIEASYHHTYDPETEITVTAGGTQALFTVIAASVQEGDQVIIFEPAYDSYGPVVKLFGGNPVYIELKSPDFLIDWDEVRKHLSSQTRMIILNTPHNPTGTVLKDSDLQALAKLVSGTKIMVLSDEVYEYLYFGAEGHHSVSQYPGLAERSFVIGSFGKIFSATGWKMGYCAAPAKLTKEFRKLHQFIVYAVNTPNQFAIADMLGDSEYLSEIADFYKQKRDYFVKLISEIGLKITPADGSYFQLVDFHEITELKSMDLAKKMTQEYGVASVPLSAFYHNNPKSGVLRFCFAKNENTLNLAAERIAKFYKDMTS